MKKEYYDYFSRATKLVAALVFILAFAWFVGSQPSVQAQASVPATSTEDISTTTPVVPSEEVVETQELVGDLVGIENGMLNFEVDGRVHSVRVGPEVVVTRNGLTSSLAELEPGDRVMVSYATIGDANDGEVISISAISGAAPGALSLPILLLLLVILILAIWLGRRMTRRNIRTTNHTKQ